MKSFNLSEWAVTHRAMVLFLIIATLIVGTFSFTRLGRLEDPDFNVPAMTAVVAWPGASAQQVQDEVLNRMERKLQEIDGVGYVRSFSRQGYGGLTLWMKGGTGKKELDAAWYQARKKIADVRGTFPEGVRGPLFNDEFTDVYAMLYAVHAPDLKWDELQALAENLKRGLQSVPGVNKVDVLGRQTERVEVEFNSQRLASLGLNPQMLVDALAKQNAMTPSSAAEGLAERTYVRISGALQSVADVEAIPIEAGGRLLRLADVATVRSARGPAIVHRAPQRRVGAGDRCHPVAQQQPARTRPGARPASGGVARESSGGGDDGEDRRPADGGRRSGVGVRALVP